MDHGKIALAMSANVQKKIAKTEAAVPFVSTLVDVSIPYKAANAKAPLAVPTSEDGGQQPTHPSVVYFPDPWRGWHYWMAHTPFPFGSGDEENPHIVVSQDGINWVEPEGISNPIFPQPARGFYSDTDLVYHAGEDRLYLFWRYVEASWTVDNILVTSSDDGVNWTPYRTTLTENKYMLSPSVVYDGENWHMWYVGADDIMKPITSDVATIRYRTADSPYGPWSDAQNTNMSGFFLRNNDIGAWHIDVNKYGEEYHMLINSNSFDLYLATSTDRLTWKYNKMNPILTKSGNGSGKFDASKIYRSCGLLVRQGSGYRYKIWYGATGDQNDWTIGYTELELNPSSLVVRPTSSAEEAIVVEGLPDQEKPLMDLRSRKGAGYKAVRVTLNGGERLVYAVGTGLSMPNENEHLLLGSEAGVKGRFVSNSGVLHIQAGKSSSDAEAILRIARYLSASNIKSFEVHADTSLFKGDIEIDNAAKGAILKSPDGSRWRVQVGNDGVLKTTKL